MTYSQALEAKRAALSGLTQRLERAAARHAALTKEATAAKSAATAVKARLDELAAVAGGEATAHEDCAREMEKLLGKRHALIAKREALQAAIRDLGSLPSEAFEQVRYLGVGVLGAWLVSSEALAACKWVGRAFGGLA